MGAQALGLRSFVARLHRLEIGAEGHLRVDDDLLSAGEPHHEVRTHDRARAARRHLRDVVDVLGHARGLDHPLELQLTPAPADLGRTQRADQLRGLDPQLPRRLGHRAHLLLQRGVGAGPPPFERHQLRLDRLQRVGRLGADRVAQHIARPRPLVRALRRQQPADRDARREHHQDDDQLHAESVTAPSDNFGQDLDSSHVSLTIGIVGLPNVGKSTLFNALTKNEVLAANYPFATIDPNVGVVGVPDKRLAVLAELHKSAKIVPATVSFVDIAGIVRGASTGEGLGNKFLANIREADAICQVIRAFSDPNVVHVDGKISPADDIETINTELILADLQTIENAMPRLQKEARLHKDKQELVTAAEQAQEVLQTGKTIFGSGLDRGPLRELQLMTAKPFLYVFNVDPDEIANPAFTDELRALVAP